MPKVSIVVPIYNAEKYLENCIYSIINQTFIDMQILLIDDGSTDRSGEICDNYAQWDTRITVHHMRNAGVSAARNAGIAHAAGMYISFVDADDEIDSHMIEDLYNLIDKGCADLSICGHTSVYVKDNKRRSVQHLPPVHNSSTKVFLEKIGDFLDSESIQGPCAKLFRTSLIVNDGIQFPGDMTYGEDTIFVYRYLAACKGIISTSTCYYFYMHRNSGSLSRIIREDKMQIYLRLYAELNSLLVRFGIANRDEITDGRICASAISCIGELYGRGMRLTAKNRRRIIKKIIGEEKVEGVFKEYSRANLQNRIVNRCISTNSIVALDVYFGIKEFVRNNMSWLYNLR